MLAGLTSAPCSLAAPASVFPILGEHGIGSAILFDSSGLLLTEATQVRGPIPPKIVISQNVVVVGRVMAEDKDHGIAVVWVNPTRLAEFAVMPLAFGDPEQDGVAIGDTISGLAARMREGPVTVIGTVRGVQAHRIQTSLPLHFADRGGVLLDSRGEVIGILRSGGSGPGAIAATVRDAVVLLEAAAESTRTSPYPSGEILSDLPGESFPPAELREIATRADHDIRDFQILAGGYTVSILTPPQCFALQTRNSESAGQWFLSGAFGDDYPPVVTIHVEPRRRSATILWPIGAVFRVGRGAAHVLGSFVGTVADGVTGAAPVVRAARSDHCEVSVLRDGTVATPLLCQGSEHVYDPKLGAFVQRKGSKAAFYYYPWQTFESTGGRSPEIALEISDPSNPEEMDHLQVPRKLLQMVAADFEPVRRIGERERVASTYKEDGAASGSIPGEVPPVLLIRLKGGSILRAAEVEAWGPREVRVVLEARERLFVPRDEIRSITDETGRDWTARVLPDEGEAGKRTARTRP
jgi:hypothetical protein